MTAATEQYLEGQDVLGEWLEECCDLAPGYWAGISELFESWKLWAFDRNEWIGSVKQFSQKLEDRVGLIWRKNPEGTKRGFAGLRLKPRVTDGNGKLVQLDPTHFAGYARSTMSDN